MDLTNHAYRFFSNKTELLDLWNGTLSLLLGHKIFSIYRAKNNSIQEWIAGSPVVIQTDVGYLSVNAKMGKMLSLGWNDIDINDNLLTCSKCDCNSLSWAKYDELSQITNLEIRNIKILGNETEITGIEFLTANDRVLKIQFNQNDTINASIERYSSSEISIDKNECPQKYCMFWSQTKCGQAFKAFGQSYDCVRKNSGGLRDWYEPCENELAYDGIPLDYFKNN